MLAHVRLRGADVLGELRNRGLPFLQAIQDLQAQVAARTGAGTAPRPGKALGVRFFRWDAVAFMLVRNYMRHGLYRGTP